MQKKTTLDIGRAIETRALAFLAQQGHRLVARNFRCRQGEIDLITLENDRLIFVEVRYRSRSDYGGALASVDTRKQGRIIHAARYFLHRHPMHQCRDCRFDIVAYDHEQPPVWIQNAFEA